MFSRTTIGFFASLLLLVGAGLHPTSLTAQESVVAPNNYVISAGELRGGQLSVNLVAESGMWYPGGEGSTGIRIRAFREQSGPLQTPGPMIRVPQGAEIVVTIRNNIPDRVLQLRGFQSRPASTANTIQISYGESETLRFSAGDPGVYYNWAATEGGNLEQCTQVDSKLTGVFIVTPTGYADTDRILVLGEYQHNPLSQGSAQFAINGRSWPNTERYEVRVGEQNRWHIVNPTFAGHPMHMHGLHYRVTAQGNAISYSTIDRDVQREVVTELVRSGRVASIEWEAVHEGNWLFHCHISAHVAGRNMISVRGYDAGSYDPATMDRMSGMAVGIKAIGDGVKRDFAVSARQLTMNIKKRENYFGDKPGFGIAFNEQGSKENIPHTPGPILFLNRDEPVSIMVSNELDEPTSIHWHGMELESYYDGVAGYSGNGSSITPAIAPGESFEV